MQLPSGHRLSDLVGASYHLAEGWRLKVEDALMDFELVTLAS